MNFINIIYCYYTSKPRPLETSCQGHLVVMASIIISLAHTHLLRIRSAGIYASIRDGYHQPYVYNIYVSN